MTPNGAKKEGENPTRFNVRLPSEDAGFIEQLAKKKRCTECAVIREIIGKAIDAGLAV